MYIMIDTYYEYFMYISRICHGYMMYTECTHYVYDMCRTRYKSRNFTDRKSLDIHIWVGFD